MSNLHKVEFRPEDHTNKQLISILEECLLRAKAGEFTGGLVVLLAEEQDMWWRTGINYTKTVGILERLKYGVLRDTHG